jgi:hydroxyethylthiazole kinase-like uncharacterized protein yjeF
MANKFSNLELNKYRKGVVLIIAGTEEYPGAAVLTVGAARRGGAGYIKYLFKNITPKDLVLQRFPDVVPIWKLNNQKFDAIVMGPGNAVIRRVPINVPLILDAKAIKEVNRFSNPIKIITPHTGEAAQLGFQVTNKRTAAVEIATKTKSICALKGRNTTVATPTGKVWIDKLGGDELAVAGTGDLLAGLIGSMIAAQKPQNLNDAFKIVCAAVTRHSRAGKVAKRKYKVVTALDVLEALNTI